MFLISQALRSFVMTRASVYYRKVFKFAEHTDVVEPRATTVKPARRQTSRPVWSVLIVPQGSPESLTPTVEQLMSGCGKTPQTVA